jgi:hypothetical protein
VPVTTGPGSGSTGGDKVGVRILAKLQKTDSPTMFRLADLRKRLGLYLGT